MVAVEGGDPSSLRLLDTFQAPEDTVTVKGCPNAISDNDKVLIGFVGRVDTDYIRIS